MQIRHALFAVSVMLFIGGIAFIIAAERTKRTTPAPSAAEVSRVTAPVASTRQIMRAVVQPAAAEVWNSVSITISHQGTEEKMPRSDDDWEQVATGAAMLVESANLLLEGNRAVDRGDWVEMARAMADSGTVALKAAQSRDTDGILKVGEAINTSCDNCHERYSRN